ncbi:MULTISPECIES: phage tail protein [unclassified Pseudomonas]|uniref:phage tail protein n=1 Tax=unclassified Pseudomonas TaxID=196821 RepID=UPI0011A3E61D|nr:MULTISPECIES: phage tail protein [unclassified Pseudomonas]TWC27718.1 phage-related protein [Pseudomonas sp. SJZ083]TWC53942.1 phage-related protein [Pseudomonas sp. SJZ077]
MAIERFTWQTEKGATGDIKQRVRTKGFGDGYSQSVSDGINNEQQSWPVTHTGSSDRIKEIITFLRRHKGAKAFLWTPPLGELGLYKCNGFQPSHKGGSVYTLTATFEQTFHP